MTATSTPEHLDPSALGTKSYWDDIYTREQTNLETNPEDVGTIWFSDAEAEEKMLEFLENLDDEDTLRKTGSSDDDDNQTNTATSFLDLGTGNGHLLVALRQEGWRGRMLGVDYSEESVRLAKNVWEKAMSAAREACKNDAPQEEWGMIDLEGDENERMLIEDISFTRWDLLKESAGEWLLDGFDVVLDKGTFDAISLSDEKDERGRRVFEGYRERVEPLIKAGGRLLITSCNWTEGELRGWMEGGELEYEDKVRYPTFTFGGKSGSQVVTLCFRKRQ